MALQYEDNGLLQAMQNKWAVERGQQPAAQIGASIGSGIESGYDTALKSGIEDVATQKKSTADFVNKILETNVPAMVVDQTKPINDPARYRLIPVEQQAQIRDAILKQTPLPPNVNLIPRKVFEPEKPEVSTTPMMAKKMNANTGAMEDAYPYQGKTGDAPQVSIYKPVDQAEKANKDAEKQAAQAEKEKQNFMNELNARRDNARESLKIAEDSIAKGIATDDREVVRQQAYLKNIDESNRMALSGDVAGAKAKLQDFNVVKTGDATPAQNDQWWNPIPKTPAQPATFAAQPARVTPSPAPVATPAPITPAPVQPPAQGKYTVGQIISTPKGNVKVIGFYPDGEPNVILVPR